MKISICIPAYRADTIDAAIKSIQNQTWPDWELLVVGQGDLQGERAAQVRRISHRAAARDKRTNYIHIEQTGATWATNAGIDAASGEILAIIDDDCEAQEDWLEIIAGYFQNFPDIEFLGGAAIAPKKDGRQRFAVCPNNHPTESVYDPIAMGFTPPIGWEWISCNIAMKRSVVQRVGPFDYHLGPGAAFPAGDDTDYKLRLEEAGIIMATTPKMVVHHTHGFRYGIKAVLDHQFNYSYGNGGLAAKLTLAGDPRGRAWLKKTMEERLMHRIKRFQLYSLLIGLRGWLIYKSAYNRCLRQFTVENGLLRPKVQLLS